MLVDFASRMANRLAIELKSLTYDSTPDRINATPRLHGICYEAFTG